MTKTAIVRVLDRRDSPVGAARIRSGRMTKTAIVQVEHCSQCPHLSKAYAEPDACSLAPTLLGGAWSDYLTPKRGIAEFCPLPDSET